MKVGDKVNWRYSPRGGYNADHGGHDTIVAGIILKLMPKSAVILVAKKAQDCWIKVTRTVKLERLSPRTSECQQLDAKP